MLASCGEGDLSFRFLSQNCVFSRLVSWHVKFLHLIRNLRDQLFGKNNIASEASAIENLVYGCFLRVVVLNTTMTDETIVAR